MANMTVFLEAPLEVNRLFRDWVAQADEIWIATAWASNALHAATALWRARRQIKALVVGLDFLQTDPNFLARFRSYVRVSTEGATFHPKIYLFKKDARYACVIGSSNFTAGGFGTNLEANVLLEGRTSSKVYLAVRDRIAALYASADVLEASLLREYTARHRTRASKIDQLRRYEPSRTVRGKLAERRAAAARMDRDRFLRELGRGRHGQAQTRAVEAFLDGLNGRLDVQWNPRGFTVAYALDGVNVIRLAIVEKRRTVQSASFAIVHGLAHDAIIRLAGQSALAGRAYEYFERDVARSFPNLLHRSPQGAVWGARLSALSRADAARIATFLVTAARWLGNQIKPGLRG